MVKTDGGFQCTPVDGRRTGRRGGRLGLLDGLGGRGVPAGLRSRSRTRPRETRRPGPRADAEQTGRSALYGQARQGHRHRVRRPDGQPQNVSRRRRRDCNPSGRVSGMEAQAVGESGDGRTGGAHGDAHAVSRGGGDRVQDDGGRAVQDDDSPPAARRGRRRAVGRARAL